MYPLTKRIVFNWQFVRDVVRDASTIASAALPEQQQHHQRQRQNG